jgi:predicted TIM-barrel fold metal-dependent hydrolase
MIEKNLRLRCGKTIKKNNDVKILDEINVSKEDKAKILGENAKRLFKL